MARYRYFIFNQKSVLVLGILQVACAGLCVVCGFMDAVFRKNTTLSETRAPLWAGLIMAAPGVLSLFASQKKNPVLVNIMIVSAVMSFVAVVIVFVYSCVTLSYGEEDDEIFHAHPVPEVRFVLSRMVKGANVTLLMACTGSLLFSSLITFVGCRSLPLCGCYNSVNGMEFLVPQNDPSAPTELICTWQGGDERIFNSPVSFMDQCLDQEQREISTLPPYSRLA
ncbi:uncharacterized protein zgc:113425 [Triplophysa rosa]|uniref:Uncharacterized protein n=1 Tax=Triplophysa rosa TaxID=992332 RepID=A0A9W7WJZ6_TRIRA|nr:uncharacterized protein zgc:113425 [Triplophysa rosa]XP_057206146.1 uncharacterized protein zgc:113425 [Triplophysa rosa]KAI7801735.1 hypothetical protein IRJ41_017626 [Triplophysa rosa]